MSDARTFKKHYILFLIQTKIDDCIFILFE